MVFEGVPLQNIIACPVDQCDFGIVILVRGKDPFPFEGLEGQNAHQQGGTFRRILIRPDHHLVAEGDGLNAVDRVDVGAGDVDALSDRRKPVVVPDQVKVHERNAVVVGVIDPSHGRKPVHHRFIHENDLDHDLRFL